MGLFIAYNGSVSDLYDGTFTQGMECMETSRRCRSVEMDKICFDFSELQLQAHVNTACRYSHKTVNGCENAEINENDLSNCGEIWKSGRLINNCVLKNNFDVSTAIANVNANLTNIVATTVVNYKNKTASSMKTPGDRNYENQIICIISTGYHCRQMKKRPCEKAKVFVKVNSCSSEF